MPRGLDGDSSRPRCSRQGPPTCWSRATPLPVRGNILNRGSRVGLIHPEPTSPLFDPLAGHFPHKPELRRRLTPVNRHYGMESGLSTVLNIIPTRCPSRSRPRPGAETPCHQGQDQATAGQGLKHHAGCIRPEDRQERSTHMSRLPGPSSSTVGGGSSRTPRVFILRKMKAISLEGGQKRPRLFQGTQALVSGRNRQTPHEPVWDLLVGVPREESIGIHFCARPELPPQPSDRARTGHWPSARQIRREKPIGESGSSRVLSRPPPSRSPRLPPPSDPPTPSDADGQQPAPAIAPRVGGESPPKFPGDSGSSRYGDRNPLRSRRCHPGIFQSPKSGEVEVPGPSIENPRSFRAVETMTVRFVGQINRCRHGQNWPEAVDFLCDRVK